MAKSFEDLVLAKLDNLLRVLTVSVTKGMGRPTRSHFLMASAYRQGISLTCLVPPATQLM